MASLRQFASMQNQRSARFAEVANIETGLALRGAAPLDPAGTHRILLASGLPSATTFKAEELPACSVQKPSDRVLLTNGDLVLLGRGEPRCSVYEGVAGFVVLAAPLMRIRLKVSSIRPEFLALHLTCPTVVTELRRAMRGSHSQFIARSDLEQIFVPIPPLQTQDRLISFNRLAKREADLTARLADLRRYTTNALLAAFAEAQQRAVAD